MIFEISGTNFEMGLFFLLDLVVEQCKVGCFMHFGVCFTIDFSWTMFWSLKVCCFGVSFGLGICDLRNLCSLGFEMAFSGKTYEMQIMSSLELYKVGCFGVVFGFWM